LVVRTDPNPKIKPISRAHLPRLLDGLNWSVLNELIDRCFGVRIQCHETSKWVAIDGKALRGTLDAGDKQNLILAVVDTGEVVAQTPQCGDKSSEIPVVRALLNDSGLEKQKVSLDAHYFNPTTTTQIHQAGGVYLTQVKENQAIFHQQCKDLHAKFLPLAETINHEKAHGRVTTRKSQLFDLAPLTLNSRWKNSGLSTLMVLERETFDVSKPKAPKTLPPLTAEELAELPRLPTGWAWVRLIEGCEEVVDCHNKTAPFKTQELSW